MMTRIAFIAALAFSACQLGPLDVTGLSCAASDECGAGFVCFERKCEASGTPHDAGTDAGADAGTDAGRDAGFDAGIDAGRDAGFDAGIPRNVNLLENPNFAQLQSDGGIVAWRVGSGRLAPSVSGQNDQSAGRIVSTNVNNTMLLIPTTDLPGAELGMVFCGTMWVKSERDAGTDVTLTIRDRYADGGVDSSSSPRVTVGPTWTPVTDRYATFGDSAIQLRLTLNTKLDAGDGVLVDSASLVLLQAGNTICP